MVVPILSRNEKNSQCQLESSTPMLTWVYSPSCGDVIPCYAYACPRKVRLWDFEQSDSHLIQSFHLTIFWVRILCKQRPPLSRKSRIGLKLSMLLSWILYRIARLIDKGKLKISCFRFRFSASSTSLSQKRCNICRTIDELFGNILDLRKCNRLLFEVLNVRQREGFQQQQRVT